MPPAPAEPAPEPPSEGAPTPTPEATPISLVPEGGAEARSTVVPEDVPVPSEGASMPAAPASALSADSEADNDGGIVHDVILRPANERPTPRAASASLSLAALVDQLGAVATQDELASLLRSEVLRSICGAHAEAVTRCLQYVRGLARENEQVLGGWPVLSINEWGHQQVRTLVLTSHALYRIAFAANRGAIDHYSRTSLGSCRLIERGAYAFKLQLTEPDGRENPFAYFWTAYVKKGSKDHRYEKVYYPIHPEGIAVELVLAVIISSIQAANHLLYQQIHQHCYVAKLEVRDYVPNPNAVDDLMDKLIPGLQRVGDKVSEGLRAVLQPNERRAPPSRR